MDEPTMCPESGRRSVDRSRGAWPEEADIAAGVPLHISDCMRAIRTEGAMAFTLSQVDEDGVRRMYVSCMPQRYEQMCARVRAWRAAHERGELGDQAWGEIAARAADLHRWAVARGWEDAPRSEGET